MNDYKKAQHLQHLKKMRYWITPHIVVYAEMITSNENCSIIKEIANKRFNVEGYSQEKRNLLAGLALIASLLNQHIKMEESKSARILKLKKH